MLLAESREYGSSEAGWPYCPTKGCPIVSPVTEPRRTAHELSAGCAEWVLAAIDLNSGRRTRGSLKYLSHCPYCVLRHAMNEVCAFRTNKPQLDSSTHTTPDASINSLLAQNEA